MKFSERWLRTLVDPPLSSAALQETLTMAGLEVETAETAAPAFSGVVVACIDAVTPHPGADRLQVCAVDYGANAPVQVVCGALNATAGMLVPYATVGAVLPGPVRITSAIMRGIESHGMLCSAKELGIGDDATGLMTLSTDAVVGTDLRRALALDDTLLTLKITPNRADCLSLLGIAREVAAITGARLSAPVALPAAVTTTAQRHVRIEDAEACPRFASRLIEGIDARAPTPAWMHERLERSGIRPISAVVDVTNYVMVELGQPLHAYDDRQLQGDIVVRFARPGETLALLNEQILDLEPDLLLVADEQKPLGLAGIMGGAHSGISESTSTILLEGAFWNPAVIRGKSRRLGFVSDAGYRFERGVDPALGPAAVERATTLILDICGGRAGPLSDVAGILPPRPSVRVRTSRVTRLLGVAIAPDVIADFFTRLHFAFERTGNDFRVTPPSYRFDLAIEEDFVEEIARLYGYDAIPTQPAAHVQHMLPAPETRRTAITWKQRLAARDWQEVVTFSFVSARWEEALFPDRTPEERPIRVLNPIASHLDVMRTTLAGGLIEALRTNLVRHQDRVRIIETGRCFERTDHGVRQPLRLGGLAYGDAMAEQWGALNRPIDVFDVKSDLQSIVSPVELTTVAGAHPALHPGRSARVLLDGQAIGWLGELHPRLARHFELPRAPILFEVDMAPLESIDVPLARPVSRLPRVRRDLSVIVDEGVPAQAVVDALKASHPSAVESIRLFDVYRGPGIQHGKKSVAILVLMQDTERTLTDAEIEATMASLLGVVIDRFDGALRQ